MSKEFLVKQEEVERKQQVVEMLEKEVKRLVSVIESLEK